MMYVYAAILANYAALTVVAALLGRAHLRVARRSGVLGLTFVGLVLGIEAAEHLVTVAAWLHTPVPPLEALAIVSVRASLSWLRLGLTWGLLLAVRHSDARLLGSATARRAWSVAAAGYRGACRSLACRLRRRRD